MKRLESLQIIRVIAMIYIVSFHCGLNHLGGAGVSIFIILSGFLLTYRNYNVELPTDVISSLVYGINKIKKLYALHIVTSIAVLPLLIYEIVLSHELLYKNISEVILNILLVKSWIPNNDIVASLNTVSWYLGTILFLYCCFPTILAIIKRQKSRGKIVVYTLVLFLLTILVSYCSSIMPIFDDAELDTVWFFSYIFPLTRLLDFAIGCNLGYMFVKSDRHHNEIVGTIFEVLAVIMILGVEKITQMVLASKIAFLNYTTICIPISAFVIWVFAEERGFITKKLNNKLISYLASRSAYVFLIHYVVSRYLRSNVIYQVNPPINQWTMFLLVLLISLLLSEVWLYIKGESIWNMQK